MSARVSAARVEDLLTELLVRGGFTTDPTTGASPAVAPGRYVVSLAGHERIVDAADTSTDALRVAIRDTLADALASRAYAGAWTDERGHYVFDVSVTVDGKRRAMRLAARNGQRAIYDMSADESLPVDTDGLWERIAS